ncbi:unnamed protein product [Mesocestoides corti]|uniref:Uncharacterized protein n=1 Tax=Mesocestoides corti TaxID=53468 RepID=A0A0R3U397_MESCO|nr:unnamed protein product [Mesocestoides corti]
MAFLTSEIITQFAVGMNPKGSENSNANSNNPSATNSVKHLSLDSQQDQYPPPLSRTLSLSPPTSPLWTRLNPS